MTYRVTAVFLALLVLCGCFRTVYRNFQPLNAPPVVETPQTLGSWPRSTWQSYFLFGVLPTERPIEAAAQCGGDAHVATIETRQTFGQSAISVAVLALFWIGIYSPWSAGVTCDHPRPF